ncbi:MAG: HsdR family type I site-specific deoxyribonuclease [Prevotella sp.]|nr:HsdR family type I site-specific deoxyribonuclease [Prevotella sp.]
MSDYHSRLEREYQDKVVQLFTKELHYGYLGKLQYGKDENCLENGQKNTPIIEDELRKFLSREGTHYTQSQIQEAIRQVKKEAELTDYRKGTLLRVNNDLYERLIYYYQVKPDADSPHENVYLFDFDNPLANHFAIAEEVSYTDGLTGSNSRPDLVVYVNGIALAVIELKRSTVTLEEGIKQNLSNESALIPSFFTTVQFTVAASDKNGFKYATIHTPEKFWCSWKTDSHKVGEKLSDMDSFRLFFDKQTFFELFRYGVINDGGTKKVMRPHQYYALKAAMPRLKEKASGVIWHSQGSGKSLTMVWLARYIHRSFENPRVLVITDRTELDMQIRNTFLNASETIHQARTSDDLLDTLQRGEQWLVCSLIHKFGRHIDVETGKEVIGDDDAPIPLEAYLKELMEIVNTKYNGDFKAKGANKFVFVDECHRTQGGRLHKAMRAIMGDDVMFIGFTGTPLLHDQKQKGGYLQYNKVKNETQVKFGPFIHTYLHKEAIEDKVILDLQYEARNVEQQISNDKKLEEKKDELLKGVKKDAQQRMIDRWATLENVYSSRERIERIGYSILDDMSQYPLNQDWSNAMLVAGNIFSAYRYYRFFCATSTNTYLRGKCAVVTSYNPSDYDLRKQDDGDDATENENEFKNEMAKQTYKDAGVSNASQYEAWAKDLFIKAPSQMKLLIVVDKLLTGFDAPGATYLYIDKDMRDHNLFQAICRVNRLGTDLKADKDAPNSATIFSHKEFGLIVDFKILFNNIKNAITQFNDPEGGLGGYEETDIEGLLEDAISKNKKRLNAALDAYDSIRSMWESKEVKGADAIVKYYTPFPPTDLDEEERKAKLEEAKMQREAFYKIAEKLGSAYANIADYILRAGYSEKEAYKIHKRVSEAISLRNRVKQASGDDFDVKALDPKMRELLDRFIRAEDAENLIPATADFSFLDLLSSTSNTDEAAKKAVDEARSEKAAAEKIVAKARAVINDWNVKDKAQSESFAKRLQAIIDSINKNATDTANDIKRLIELLKDMKAGKWKYPEGIETDIAKALWNNRKDWTDIEDETETIGLIREIDHYIIYNAYDNWRDLRTRDGRSCINGLRTIVGDASTEEQIYAIHRIAANNYHNN